MKHLIFILFIFLEYQVATAQHLGKGYYVTLNGDTIQSEIKIPKDLFGSVRLEVLERKIKTTDSSTDALKTLTEKDIKGYGFNYKGKDFRYALKHLTDKKQQFFQELATGKIAGCYYYFKTGNKGAINETILIERQSTRNVLLKNSMTKKKIRRLIHDLFADRQDAMNLIDHAVLSKQHFEKVLATLVDSINQL